MQDIHIDGWLISSIGGILSLLLLIIAYFLDRLIKQFDGLSTQFRTLNDTMLKIDKDLSRDVGIIQAENHIMKERVESLDPLWDRMRIAESDIVGLKASCVIHKGDA